MNRGIVDVMNLQCGLKSQHVAVKQEQPQISDKQALRSVKDDSKDFRKHDPVNTLIF